MAKIRKKKVSRNYQSTKSNHKKNNKKVPIVLGEYVFPIYGMSGAKGHLQPTNIYGTCFSIGRNYFLTALHVVNAAKATSEETKIGFFSQINAGCVNMNSYEVKEEFPESDLAIIESKEIFQHEKKPRAFKWKGSKLLIFEDVRAMGYPYGYSPYDRFSIGRGFSGNILCETPYERGELKARCYELSFQAPRGLSGGCLIDKYYNIHGIVIGNSKKEIHVFQDEITITEGDNKIKRIETINETTFIGMAITEEHIFDLQSRELGGTIHDYLKEEGLH